MSALTKFPISLKRSNFKTGNFKTGRDVLCIIEDHSDYVAFINYGGSGAI